MKGSSVIEVLIASILVAICCSACYICFHLVNTNSKSIYMLKAMEMVEEMKVKAEKEKDYAEDERELGSLKVTKSIEDTENPDLKLLRFEIMEDTLLLEKVNYLIVEESESK